MGGIRVISGAFRGRRILSLPGMETRPTADRVKEAVFNILADQPAGKYVLDLFAGTGSLGIEALSRGAVWVDFVDFSPECCRLIQRNLNLVKAEKRARVIRQDVCRGLSSLKGRSYGLVFLDPPYNRQMVKPAIKTLATAGILDPGAIIVIEHGKKEDLLGLDELYLYKRRKYGKTLVSFGRYMV